MLVSRTFVIEAVLHATDPTFDPATMQPNTPSAVSPDPALAQFYKSYSDGDWGNAANPYRNGRS